MMMDHCFYKITFGRKKCLAEMYICLAVQGEDFLQRARAARFAGSDAEWFPGMY
jgi:hypothetical protein